jgi:hypothetical protein
MIYVNKETSPISPASGSDVDMMNGSVQSDVTTEAEEPEVILMDESDFITCQDGETSNQADHLQGIEDLLSSTNND